MEQEKFGKLCKERMVEELLSCFKEHPDFFVTSYMGSSVADLEILRKNLTRSQTSYVVVKNSILSVVFDKLKFKDMAKFVDGGIGISFSGSDIVSTCKALVGFAKEHDKFKIRCAYLEGRAVPAERVKELATIPSKEILLARVVGGIKSPITGFVNTLGALLRKFVFAVEAIRVKKEKLPNV